MKRTAKNGGRSPSRRRESPNKNGSSGSNSRGHGTGSIDKEMDVAKRAFKSTSVIRKRAMKSHEV